MRLNRLLRSKGKHLTPLKLKGVPFSLMMTARAISSQGVCGNFSEIGKDSHSRKTIDSSEMGGGQRAGSVHTSGGTEGGTRLAFYTHTHTHTAAHTRTLPPSFLGAGREGAALTQEVRKPRGQSSHNFGPFKPSPPRQPMGKQWPPLPPRPPPHPDPSRAPRRPCAYRTRLPPAPPPSAGTARAPERLCAAPRQPALRPRGPAPHLLTESPAASQREAPSSRRAAAAGRRGQPGECSHGGRSGTPIPAGWSPREVGRVKTGKQDHSERTCQQPATCEEDRTQRSRVCFNKPAAKHFHLVSCLTEGKSVFHFQLHVLSLKMWAFVHSNSPTSA
ncbi:WW domain-binding protein 11-like [Nycticebus coucang]|uniref:WW domain-binding protein 11-like n=1 Tax=Nycticebus coucang TaxID=9470 RepID=UPI00234E2C06|nr:WW domain-binding protein 11-like [Nycticebus coucang]